MQYPKNLVLFFLTMVFMIAQSVSAQEVLLIANNDVAETSLTAHEVQQIFLGKKTTWENGKKITFFTTNADETHTTFLKAYVGKSPSQFKTFWKKQVFTGKGKSPVSSADDQEMVGMVASTSGAIGYVAVGTDTSSAKTIPVQ